MTKLIEGQFLELIPRDPPARLPGLSLVGQLMVVEGPVFFFVPAGDCNAVIFRADENEEIAVRLLDRSTWEIGRSSSRRCLLFTEAN